MSWLKETFTSSIGRKVSMSLTGLFLVSFLLVHLSGNLSLYKHDNGEAFNLYSHFMSTNPIIRVLEIGLLAGFLIHIYTAIVLTNHNKASKPIGYAYKQTAPGVSWFSQNMGLSGSIVLIFLIVHLYNFWYRYHYGSNLPMTVINGEEYKDMYAIVKECFKEMPIYGVLYVGAMVLLGFHLNHGFVSGLRTLGLEHKKYTPIVKQIGGFISVVIPAAFASFPIYFFLF